MIKILEGFVFYISFLFYLCCRNNIKNKNMTQYKLIKIDGYWIVVSNEGSNKGDLTVFTDTSNDTITKYNTPRKAKYDYASNSLYNFKVLFSQNPEHNLLTITFSDEVAKELGIVDVEKLAYLKYGDDNYERIAFIRGVKWHAERMCSEEEVINILKKLRTKFPNDIEFGAEVSKIFELWI